MYTFPELAAIFRNCKSVKELVHASAIFLMLIEDGLITENQKNFIHQSIQIRKRQF